MAPTEKFQVLVCGDRNWKNREVILDRLERMHVGNLVVIHGAARGADTIGGEVASGLGHEVIAVPANWKKHGRAAGPIRNQAMLLLEPDYVLAFHNCLEESKGTKDMVQRAARAGITCEVIKDDGSVYVITKP